MSTTRKLKTELMKHFTIIFSYLYSYILLYQYTVDNEILALKLYSKSININDNNMRLNTLYYYW